MSSYETAVARVREVAGQIAPKMKIVVQPPYGDAPDYIAALVDSAANHLEAGFDHLLFSFHGIPERHLRKSDPTGGHCLTAPNCCETASPAHATCYRAQCFKTMAAFVAQAGIPANQCSISFQSRLGRDPWLKPYTDFELVELPKRGSKTASGHLPGVRVGLSGNAGGNRPARARNIFIGGRGGIRANPVSERASALDFRAGENGPRFLKNQLPD
jgi:protoheme ferro-lyase